MSLPTSSQLAVRRIALLSVVACALLASRASAQSSPALHPHSYSLGSSTLRLAEVVELQVRPLPEEQSLLPRRRYTAPLLFMGAGFAAAIVGGSLYSMSDNRYCIFGPCTSPPPPKEDIYLIPTVLGTALFAAGMTWLVARVMKYRRARFEQRNEYRAW